MTGAEAGDTLASHLAWAEPPWLGFVFTPDLRALHALQRRVDAAGRQVVPHTPQKLRSCLPRLLDASQEAGLVWVVAVHDESPSQPPGPWTEALDWLLMRANERRQQLLAAVDGLLFVAHPSVKARIREAAPDLWSVRSLVLELPASPPSPRTWSAAPVEPMGPSLEELVGPDAVAELVPLATHAEALFQQGWAAEAAEAATAWVDAARELPGASDRARSLAAALELRARAHRQLGDLDGSLADLDEALSLRRHTASLPGDDAPERTAALARALSLGGQVQWEAGAGAIATQSLREALDLRQQLARWSDDAETLSDLALAWSLLGDVARDGGAEHEAEEAYREAVRLRRRVGDETGAHRHLRLLSVALGRLGRHLFRQERTNEARDCLDEAVALATQLTAADPGRVAWQMEASVAQTRLAEVLQQLGDLDGALDALRQAVAVRRELAEHEPDNARWQTLLAVARGKVADVAMVRGELDLAREAAAEALELTEAAHPRSPQDLRGLARAWIRCGDVARATGDALEARRCWEQALQLVPAVAPSLPRAAADLAETLRDRGLDTP